MKKILVIASLFLSFGIYSQDIKIEYNEEKRCYKVISKQPILQIDYARIKDKLYMPLKTIKNLKKVYFIPNKYFKYRNIKVTIKTKNEMVLQHFITKNKRK